VSVPQFLDRHSVVGMVADVQINVIASPAHRMKGRAGVIHAVNAKAEHVVASATIGGLRHIPDLFVHRDVVTAVAGVQRGVRAGPDQVVPITAIDQPSVTSRVDIVIAIATIDGDRLARKIDIVLAAATIQRRIARVELQTSIPGLDIRQAAIDRIRAVAGAYLVIASPAIDPPAEVILLPRSVPMTMWLSLSGAVQSMMFVVRVIVVCAISCPMG